MSQNGMDRKDRILAFGLVDAHLTRESNAVSVPTAPPRVSRPPSPPALHIGFGLGSHSVLQPWMSMMVSLSSIVVLGFASFAGVRATPRPFFTTPSATVGFTGGQPANITWTLVDFPGLPTFGNAKATVSSASPLLNSTLQLISDNVDINTLFLPFTPDPSIGPNGRYYFIVFESLNDNSSFRIESFSPAFTLSGMTGSFNMSIVSTSDGQLTSGHVPPTTSTGSATGSGSVSASATNSANATGTPAPAENVAASVFVGGYRKLWLAIVMGIFCI
ncbi:hypothetical protein MVEN_01179500 [Mycena venus]|uniref:Uncharacterized protein n=1 Tax=Mycena venus TaxID=2733690 RepID=A0A8H6Y2L6_9AGAR|nr:hypothetical protein MVEN_01179500 [Mycena venus]